MVYFSYFFICLYLLYKWRAGYGSESEPDDEAATVSLSSDIGRVNRASTKSAVKLQEIGPRMTLQLVKIEEGLCTGRVIFSEYGIFLYNLPFLLLKQTILFLLLGELEVGGSSGAGGFDIALKGMNRIWDPVHIDSED